MAVLILALGIGTNTAIFSIVNTVLLRPLPFKDPDKIVMIWETNPKKGVERSIVSPANYLDWKARNHVFENIVAWRFWFFNLTGTEEPERIQGFQVGADYFQLLGVRAALGRTFLPEEEQVGKDKVVILSQGLWQRRFGGAIDIIGRKVQIDGDPYTVVGILPADFKLFRVLNREIELWVPLTIDPQKVSRDDFSINVYGRLKAGVSIEQAQAELETIARSLGQEYPTTNADRGVAVVGLQNNSIQRYRDNLLLLLAAVIFVLLIACANIANLLLARAAGRQREVAIRAALGASRSRLIRQLLTESLLLALLGGTLGLVISLWGIDLLNVLIPHRAIPRYERFSVDRYVLGFTLLLSFLTGIMFGIVPGLRTSKINLTESLKEGGKSLTTGVRGLRIFNILVVSEVALAAMLLIGAGLMIKSSMRLQGFNRGFNPGGLLTMQVWLPRSKYSSSIQITNFYQQTMKKIETLPGVLSVSAINFLPLSGLRDSVKLTIEGHIPAAPEEQPFAMYSVIGPEYFHTMGIPLLKGRGLTEKDSDEANGVVLINESMARRYWPDEDPVGKRIRPSFPEAKAPWRPDSGNNWLTIIGVVGDVREDGLVNDPIHQIYLPYLQNPSPLMNLVIRTKTNPMEMAAPVQKGVWAVDKDQPVFNIKTMDEIISESFSEPHIFMLLLGIFAALALVLSMVGIYGVIAYSVSQRSREIGIRIALGAQGSDVLRTLLKQGVVLSLTGLAIGLLAASILTRALTSLLFGVSATDFSTFALISILIFFITLLAVYIPARRVLKVDPMIALRSE
jgi:putative ABC transport system permease protein